MGHRIRKPGFITATILLFSVFCFCLPACAEPTPSIITVTVDLSAHSILINGTHFDSTLSSYPRVFLGGEQLVVTSHTNGLINATLPDDIAEGSYLLEVLRSKNKHATFDVTIGASLFGIDTNQAEAGVGAECTLGEVLLTAASVANGIPANGQLMPIAGNAALYSLYGTKYGGDGATTFAVPDLRAVAPNGLTYSICNTNAVFPSH